MHHYLLSQQIAWFDKYWSRILLTQDTGTSITTNPQVSILWSQVSRRKELSRETKTNIQYVCSYKSQCHMRHQRERSKVPHKDQRKEISCRTGRVRETLLSTAVFQQRHKWGLEFPQMLIKEEGHWNGANQYLHCIEGGGREAGDSEQIHLAKM